jgi:hypothetical protein
VVEGVAAALRDEAQRIASAHELLLALRDTARWDGPAGEAFADRVRVLPPRLDAVCQRYAGAAAALRSFAAEFREAQREADLATTLRERGALRRDRFGEAVALAESSQDPAELARVPLLRQLMAQGAAEVVEGEERHLRAHERFARADRRCRDALQSLAAGSLADPWAYDAVKGVAAAADALASTAAVAGLVPVWRPVAGAVGLGAAGAGLLTRGAVKVVYGEGTWAGLAGRAALAASGVGAGSLRQASQARGLPSAAHQGPVGFATPGDCLVAGARAHAHRSLPWRRSPEPGGPPHPAHPSPTAPLHRPRSSPLLSPGQRARQVARQVVRRQVAAARVEWQVAARSGDDARAMLLAGWGLRAGAGVATAASQTAAAHERHVAATRRREGTWR